MRLYRFLTGLDNAAFCHKVTDALNKGWQLYGSPCYSINTTTGITQCGQAVIKDVAGNYTPDIELGDY
ncbi:MAG: hypothetical protein JSC189_000833 [Candidatus Tokpelaia sp. JSC189]|nr:MAG: hypothetical protein JSC189_000833 [Candidatus Tokpelaia sp. JSC189]